MISTIDLKFVTLTNGFKFRTLQRYRQPLLFHKLQINVQF